MHLDLVHDDSKVHVLREVTLNMVPEQMRRLADRIEAGEFGDDASVCSLVIVNGERPAVFGWGKASDAVLACNLEIAKLTVLSVIDGTGVQ